MKSALSLLKTRRFLPLLLTQFLAAFNDNLYKNALIILLVFGTSIPLPFDAKILVTLAAGLFILPYVLFSALAGQLADRFEKARLARLIKWWELSLILIALLGFALQNVWVLLSILFCLGVQSTFFSPIKYSLIPDHLRRDEMLAGNSLLESSTFLAILAGTITGGVCILFPHGIELVCAILVICSLIGLVASYYIPPSGPFEPELTLDANLPRQTGKLIAHGFAHPVTRRAILASSWFWLIGATYFSQFPVFTQQTLLGSEEVITLLLTAFSIGIAAGAIASHRLARGVITPAYVPYALIGITLFTVDLYIASSGLSHGEPIGAALFVSQFETLRVLFDLVMIALCGGLFIVPLNSLLQLYTQPQQRARIIAANNVLNAAFMTLSSGGIALLLWLEVGIPEIFLLVAALNLLWLPLIFRLRRDCKIIAPPPEQARPAD